MPTIDELKKNRDEARELYYSCQDKVINLDFNKIGFQKWRVACDISYDAYLVYMDALTEYTHALEK